MKVLPIFILACIILSCSSKPKKAERTERIFALNESETKMGPTGTPKRLVGAILQIKNADDAAAELYSMIAHEPIFKLAHPQKELRLLKSEKDNLGYLHLTFARVHAGIEIWGDELKFHINDKNELYLFDGNYQPSLPDEFSASPTLTSEEAEEAAKQTLTLSYANRDETKLFIFPSNLEYRTTWRVIVGKTQLSPDQWECLVDAETGDILYKSNLIRSN